jgi:hypothetical protein
MTRNVETSAHSNPPRAASCRIIQRFPNSGIPVLRFSANILFASLFHRSGLRVTKAELQSRRIAMTVATSPQIS